MTYKNVVLGLNAVKKRDCSRQTHNLSSLLCGHKSHYAGLMRKRIAFLRVFFFPRPIAPTAMKSQSSSLQTRAGKGGRTKGGRTAWKIGRHSPEFEGVPPNGCSRINNSWRFRGRDATSRAGKKKTGSCLVRMTCQD